MAGKGKPGPKTNKQKAQEANTKALGRASDKTETSGDYADYKNKILPKSHTEFRNVLSHLNNKIEKLHKNPPKGVSLVNLTVFEKAFEIAMRDNTEVELVECPHCKKNFEYDLYSPQKEKNSIAVHLKLMDKLAPNLAAITQDINVNFLVTNLSEFFINTISTYVPQDEKVKVMTELRRVMNNVVDAEYSEVNDGK